MCLIAIYVSTFYASRHIETLYKKEASVVIVDRNGLEIAIEPNVKGHYMRPSKEMPQELKNLLIAREDRFFYYHPGVNPASIARSLVRYIFTSRFAGSSTLTQQLTKNLLGNENERTLYNKIVETFYALSLELHTKKSEILSMYIDTAYFGNQAEGIEEAAKRYFGATPDALTKEQITELLATLRNPARIPKSREPEPIARKSINSFEVLPLANCDISCELTVDSALTDTLREILQKHLASPAFETVRNGAIVVIYVNNNKNSNELLALVGSPFPYASSSGYQINMAIEPRPIGSTWKPFIYAKAFEKGARPYTIVDDIEYKYDIGTGFAFYPKNYDGIYHGPVTMHYALSNSLNVPAVRALQFVGVEEFAKFLTEKLALRPRQELETYQLSIALGGLEMDLLTLANYFSIFPRSGMMKPLETKNNAASGVPQKIFDPEYTELVTKILSDRTTGVDQFGLKSNLNLPSREYAVKTGTTYDYHDSWTIGYTPDFVVGVWLGNSDNKAMQQLSGSVGAGKIWHDVMNVLLNSEYNSRSTFNFEHIKEYAKENTIEYGLAGDNYEYARDLLKHNELILQPHDGDVFRFEAGMTIPFVARENAVWYINGKEIGRGKNISWKPERPGQFIIEAKSNSGNQKLKFIIKNKED